MKANRETVSEFQQFDAVMHKVLSDSREELQQREE